MDNRQLPRGTHLLAVLLCLAAPGHRSNSQMFSSAPSDNSTNSLNRIRLFRFQPGFLCDIPGLESDDQPASEEDGLNWFNCTVGNDNPFFELRQRGDPGGVGYTRVHTQLQLLDTRRTACSLGLQAVAPTGLQFDGLPEHMGPTVLTPALSLFHELDDNLALQAFVGKNLPLANRTAQPVRQDVQYGVAVQRPISTDAEGPLRNVYLSLGALGLLRTDRTGGPGTAWEVLPGLYYHVPDSWSISCGLIVPVGAAQTDAAQRWQVTCSLQF